LNHWPTPRHFLVAAIAVAIVGVLGAVAYVKLGMFNVAASHPHSQLVEWITHDTMINSVKRRAADVPLPATISAAQAKRGFCQYEAHCVACHGGPAVAREQWVNGMNPAPPYLLDATRQWTPRELHWIVRNGIKMTGMPAWRDTLSEREIGDVVAYLEAMPQMPPQSYVAWRGSRVCGPTG
jgi:mono/diheme cytochrome c family protein